MAAQRPSPFIGLARVGLTVAVAIGLARVFDDGGWPLAAASAAIAPHAIIAYGDRRRWGAPLLLATLVAAVFILTMYVVEPYTLRGALPTGDTIDIYLDNLRGAPHELRTAVVPVDPIGSSLLLALLALFAAGAVAEWSARRLDVSLGAVGPSLVLFVATAALGDGAWASVTMVYALAVAAYLLALHTSELLDRRSWFHAGNARRSQLLSGGSLAAVAIVCTAALVGPQLPGARSEAWFDYRSLGDGEGGGILRATTPIVDIQAKLQPENAENVAMVVSASTGQRWRVIGLDVYDGELWTLDDKGDDATEIPEATEDSRAFSLTQSFTIYGTDPHWLPAAYRPVSVSLRNAKVVRNSLTLYLDSDEPLTDLEYRVESRVADPTPAELAASQPVDPEEFERYVALPDDVPDRIVQKAQDIIEQAGAETPYEQAIALRDYLRDTDRFTYNLDVARKEDLDSLEDFLFVVQEGYCEQFATAYGVMARSIGLPTRIAVGYTEGEDLGGGRWQVRNKNAHAWPEVYLDGIGWFPFEPTPGFSDPLEGGGGTGENPGSNMTTTTATPGTTVPGQAPPTSFRFPEGQDQLQIDGEATSAPDERSTAERIFASVVLFVLAIEGIGVVALVTLFVLAWRRRWRRRHASDPRQRVIGAWSQAIDHLAEVGINPRPSATASEFALRYAPAQGAGDAGAPLVYLARLQTVAMFAPNPPTDAEADEAWRYTDQIDKALWSKISRLVRLRRRLDPRGRDGGVND